ncbi:MAG: VOC family protein [Pseudomonadota bacterium]
MTDRPAPLDDWRALSHQQRQRVFDALMEGSWDPDEGNAEAFKAAGNLLRALAVDDSAALRLNQVTLPCTDIARAIDFYTGMGFTLIVDSPAYARFACPGGTATFSVHNVDDSPAVGDYVVYFETAALDETVEELKERDYEFTQDPEDQPWLWREARLNDPDGNVICLFYAGENRIDPPWRVG